MGVRGEVGRVPDERVMDTIYSHVNDEQVSKAAGEFDPLAAVAPK